MNIQHLPGIYELESLITDKAGVPIEDAARPSMFTFTRDGRLSVVSASQISVMAYVGSYKVEGDVLKIQVDSCVVRELEGTEMSRKILRLNSTHLVLEALGAKSGLHSVLSWKKKVSL
jgi:hypothetical protein